MYSNEFHQFLSVIDPFFASPPPADNMQISASNWNFTHSPHYYTKTGHFVKCEIIKTLFLSKILTKWVLILKSNVFMDSLEVFDLAEKLP